MKGLLPLLFVLNVYCSFAAQKDYTFYYKQTQKAEEALLDKNFKTCLKYYDAAFKEYDFKFARDCFIAAQVAAHLNDDVSTLRYACYSIRAGIKIDCFKQNALFKNFTETGEWTKLNDVKDSLWAKYKSSVNVDLLNEFTQRFDEEQNAKNAGNNEEYFEVIDLNVERIKHLLRQRKFPGEKLLGVRNTIIETKIKEHMPVACYYSSDLVLPTLLHYNYSYFEMKGLLMDAMLAGQLSPNELVRIFVFSKYKVCIYRKGQHDIAGYANDSTAAAKMIFGVAFEKDKGDKDVINASRDKWFLPKINTKLTPNMLYRTYGINTMIGEYL